MNNVEEAVATSSPNLKQAQLGYLIGSHDSDAKGSHFLA